MYHGFLMNLLLPLRGTVLMTEAYTTWCRDYPLHGLHWRHLPAGQSASPVCTKGSKQWANGGGVHQHAAAEQAQIRRAKAHSVAHVLEQQAACLVSQQEDVDNLFSCSSASNVAAVATSRAAPMQDKPQGQLPAPHTPCTGRRCQGRQGPHAAGQAPAQPQAAWPPVAARSGAGVLYASTATAVPRAAP